MFELQTKNSTYVLLQFNSNTDAAADDDDADDAVAKLNMCGNQDILRGTTLEWKSPPLVN